MKHLLKLFLYFLTVGIAIIALILFLLPTTITYKPCETFKTTLASDTITFPIEGTQAKDQFGGMVFDPEEPFFWYSEKGDTTIRMLFRRGYPMDKLTKNGVDHSITKDGDVWVENYELKGIYAYLFYFSGARFESTVAEVEAQYGTERQKKISFNNKIPYQIWKIGPCHHLLVYKKRRYQMVDEVRDEKEYTYLMFVYNLAAEEADDAVELEGGIRNDMRSQTRLP